MTNRVQNSKILHLLIHKHPTIIYLMYLSSSLDVNVSTMFISTMYNNGMELHEDPFYDTT